jgi:pSer/pThr/pTyr-binding forkhead associated (FHA) protein
MVSIPEPDPRLTSAPADPVAAGHAAAAPETTLTFQAIKRDTLPAPGGGLSAAHQAAVDALPAGSALLVVQQGPTAGARFLLATDRITAGRHPSSDIFLDDVTVSRKHAEFLRRDGGFVLRDVGGLNGTYIGRDRIDEAVLHNGDEVRVGKFRMVFYASPRSSPDLTS